MRTLIQSGIRRARKLKTGQTTSYGSGTGLDDGASQKGIAKAYTVLTAGQYAGTTNIAVNGKTDAHTNNCVLDANTGLLWSRRISASVGPASSGTLPWTTTGADATAEGIFPYVTAANAAGLAGYSDWRIPNLFELLSLADLEAPSGAPDSTAFPDVLTSNLHSSSTTPNDTTKSAVVSFVAGTAFSQDKTTATKVLLVRGG